MGIKIDIKPTDLKTLLGLLQKYLPNTLVWAFGSRVKFTANPNSDLDLVAFIAENQKLGFSLLKEAFAESNLPFKVDLHNWNDLPENFKKNIESSFAVIQECEKIDLPIEWKTYKLSELVEIKYGKDHKHLADGEIPLYGSGGIMRYVDTPLYEQESILIPRKGTLSNLFYLNIPFWSVDTMFYTKIKDGNNGKYLYYLLKSMDLASMNVGSAVPSLTTEVLNKVEINVPDEATQIIIAQILSSLDDKIELNLQMNQTLEAMAQTLFKEWFVNFKFPDFNGELYNGLPIGWRKSLIKEICEVNSSTLSSKEKIDEIHYIEISEVDKGIIKEIKIFKRGEEPSRARRKLKHGDTVLSTVRPNRGSYFLALYPNENLIASTGFAVFSPTSVPFTFLYLFLTNEEQLEFYGKMADGGAYPAINPSVIMNMEINLPTNEILEMFHNITGNLLIKAFNNLAENKILSETRDTLLPKLMSGKIEINE